MTPTKTDAIEPTLHEILLLAKKHGIAREPHASFCEVTETMLVNFADDLLVTHGVRPATSEVRGFEHWWNEIENFSLRAERLADPHEAAKAAWDAAMSEAPGPAPETSRVPDGQRMLIEDMAMLIGRMAYRVKRGLDMKDIGEKAQYFLNRHDLNGSPLRKNDGAILAAPSDAPEASGVDLAKAALVAEISRLKEIIRLIEECSEVQKVACKSGRFGADYTNPATGQSNAQELKQECADLTVVICDAVDTDNEEFISMQRAKREKITQWKRVEDESVALLNPAPGKDGGI